MRWTTTKAAGALMALAALGVLAQASAEEPSLGSVVVESMAAHQSPTRAGMGVATTRVDSQFVETQVGDTVLLEDEAGIGKAVGDSAKAQTGDGGKQAYESLPESIYAKRDVSRRDFNGHKVTNDFCGGPKYYADHKCSSEYKESIAMTASPFIGWAILSLFIWFLVLVGRNCCLCFGAGLFGGRYPTKGWCYGELRDAEQGYSECERRTFLMLVILIFLLVVVGMIVAFVGNSELSDGMSSLIDITGDIPVKMSAIVTPMQAQVSHLQQLAGRVNPYIQPKYWDTIKDGLAQAITGAADMKKQVDNSLGDISSYEDDRSTWTYSGLWVPFVLALVGMLAYLCPVLLPCFVVPLVAIMTAVIWVAVGVHVPVSVATADFCVGLHHGLTHPNASSPLDILVGCHGETGATKMVESAKYFEHTAVHVACETLNKTMCAAEEISYPDKHGATQSFHPVVCPQLACKDEASLATFMKETVVRDFLWGCAKLESGNIVTEQCQYTDKAKAKDECLKAYGNTDIMPCVQGSTAPYQEVSISVCNRTCHHASVKEHSRTVVGNYELAGGFKTIGHKIKPLSDCSFVREQAARFEHKLCWDVVSGSDFVMAGLMVIAVAFLVGNFIYLGAYKRFHRKYLGERWAEERERILYGADAGAGQPLLGAPRDADQV